ncbi:TnpV protein [Lachnospiraceae bacterium MD329]|nr:TnpV protein [Lachnospiraceae bacterium MD329]
MTEAVTYTKVGDYRIPNLTVPTEEYQIGKYGMMRRTYLKEHRPNLYSILMMKGELLKHLEEIDRITTQQVQTIVAQMAKAEGLTEEMKSTDPLLWTGLMNNFLHSAEEIVLSETVYS